MPAICSCTDGSSTVSYIDEEFAHQRKSFSAINCRSVLHIRAIALTEVNPTGVRGMEYIQILKNNFSITFSFRIKFIILSTGISRNIYEMYTSR